MAEVNPQYTVVLKKLQILTERLKCAKEVNTLLQKFEMQTWIAVGTTATADDLVKLALSRIKDQVTDYDVFIRMLRSMPGVETIADQMIGVYNICSSCTAQSAGILVLFTLVHARLLL